MIKNGKGGANTNKNGLAFQEKCSSVKVLKDKGYPLKPIENVDSTVEAFTLEKNGKPAVIITRDSRMYKDIASIYPEANSHDVMSKEIKTDDAVIDLESKIAHIFEARAQNVNGSTDDKLASCEFKRLELLKFLGPLGFDVRYTFICSDFFKHPKYKDLIDYINSKEKCFICFNEFPLDTIEILKDIDSFDKVETNE